ncbi:putative gastrula zinc finger protein XlCGF57.1-like, partial [Triplophysa rosa]
MIFCHLFMTLVNHTAEEYYIEFNEGLDLNYYKIERNVIGVTEEGQEHSEDEHQYHNLITGENSFSSSQTDENSPQKRTKAKHSFACHICGKTYSRKGHLQDHIMTHTEQKPFSCPRCGNRFKHKRSVAVHMKSHTGDELYTCPQCDKTFTAKKNLENHIRVHTGEKPFKCPQCDKSFTQQGHLKYHIRLHT